MTKQFTMIDEDFKCLNCHQLVNPLGYTARDHCPHCLHSLHVDNNPGDRANNCHGLLKPIKIENFKKTYKIIYQCQTCGIVKKNIMARDDNFDLIIELSKNQ